MRGITDQAMFFYVHDPIHCFLGKLTNDDRKVVTDSRHVEDGISALDRQSDSPVSRDGNHSPDGPGQSRSDGFQTQVIDHPLGDEQPERTGVDERVRDIDAADILIGTLPSTTSNRSLRFSSLAATSTFPIASTIGLLL